MGGGGRPRGSRVGSAMVGTLALPASAEGRSAGVGSRRALGTGLKLVFLWVVCGILGCWTRVDPDGICGLAQLCWARTLRALR